MILAHECERMYVYTTEADEQLDLLWTNCTYKLKEQPWTCEWFHIILTYS